MTFKQYINESWETSVKTPEGTAEVFKNPSAYEVLDLVKSDGGSWELRAIWKRPNLYVWNAKQGLHYPVLRQLGLSQATVSYLYANKRYVRPQELALGGDPLGGKKFAKLTEFIDGAMRRL